MEYKNGISDSEVGKLSINKIKLKPPFPIEPFCFYNCLTQIGTSGLNIIASHYEFCTIYTLN